MKRVRLNDNDRVSIDNLTDDHLICILSYMETEDAVRGTCCLSKRWKNLWKVIPSLNFNSDSFQSLVRFDMFVGCFLAKRDLAPVKTLIYRRNGIDWSFLLNSMISYVTSLNVEEIRINLLDTRGESSPVYIPMSTFTCKSMKRLELKGCFPSNVETQNENQTSNLQRLDIIRFSTWASFPDKCIPSPFGLKFTMLTSMHLNKIIVKYANSGCSSPFDSCVNLTNLHLSQLSFRVDGFIPTGFVISPPKLKQLRLTCNKFSSEVKILGPVLSEFTYVFNAQLGDFSIKSMSDGLTIDILEKQHQEASFSHTFVKMTRRPQEGPDAEISYRKIEVSQMDAPWINPESLPYTGLSVLTLGEGSMDSMLFRN